MSARFLKVYKILCILVFCLVALGGAVRAMNAGLSCPDWPLCFGDFIPDYHPQVYFEFIHRCLAGFVGLVTVTLSVLVIRSNQVKNNVKSLSVFVIVLLALQILMGGLTVLLNLREQVVATHLALGTAFFATLVWIYFCLRVDLKPVLQEREPRGAKLISNLAVMAVYMQIILGGFVASNYAALACTDFPLCHGQFIPTLRGIIGVHVIHRLGAYAVTLVLVSYVAYLLRGYRLHSIRRAAYGLLGGITLQLILGISNILLMRPPLITVLHLATGTAILGLTVYLNRQIHFASESI